VAAILAQLPALPLHEAGKYVAAAYITVFVLVLVYVAVMALRVGRIERELGELAERTRERFGGRRGEPVQSPPEANRP
jgi:CcmD family protein